MCEVAQREISLSEKETKLRELQAQTDVALNQMMVGEKEAKTQKKASEKLQKEVEIQMVEIGERTEIVQKAGPVLEQAFKEVQMFHGPESPRSQDIESYLNDLINAYQDAGNIKRAAQYRAQLEELEKE